MSKAVLDLAKKILDNHQYLNLGTVSSSGQPSVHTLAYASDGVTAYFFTDKTSRKSKNIEKNPKVAYTIDDDRIDDWMKMLALQVEGVAKIVADKTEAEKATGLIMKKFPAMTKMPPNPNMGLMKVEAKEVLVLDHSKGFGHRDIVRL